MKKKKINKEKIEERILNEVAKAGGFIGLGMIIQRIATEGISWISTIGYFG